MISLRITDIDIFTRDLKQILFTSRRFQKLDCTISAGNNAWQDFLEHRHFPFLMLLLDIQMQIVHHTEHPHHTQTSHPKHLERKKYFQLQTDFKYI